MRELLLPRWQQGHHSKMLGTAFARRPSPSVVNIRVREPTSASRWTTTGSSAPSLASPSDWRRMKSPVALTMSAVLAAFLDEDRLGRRHVAPLPLAVRTRAEAELPHMPSSMAILAARTRERGGRRATCRTSGPSSAPGPPSPGGDESRDRTKWAGSAGPLRPLCASGGEDRRSRNARANRTGTLRTVVSPDFPDERVDR